MVKMQWSLLVVIVMGQCSSVGGQLCVYHFIKRNMTWTEAQKYCRENHTDLATVSNQVDMQRLRSLAQYPGGAWIGLQRDWHWSQPGVKFNESKWYTGQPDNKDNKENCVRMNVGTWDDDSCSETYKFICSGEHHHHPNKPPGQTFYISDDNKKMNWRDAQRFCRDHHTDLISGVNQLEDFKTQNPNYYNTDYCKNEKNKCAFWIGLFRDSDWSWSDGTSFSFRSWDGGEPNNPNKTCAVTTSNGNWSSDDCNKTKPFFCYNDSVILINQSMIWEDALYYCRGYYRDLVSITNEDQQRWVQERAKMASTAYVWLGLRYTCTLDFWFWVSDQTVDYKNWGPGEPVDDCNMSGAMHRNGTWVKKIDNDHKFNFICSK